MALRKDPSLGNAPSCRRVGSCYFDKEVKHGGKAQKGGATGNFGGTKLVSKALPPKADGQRITWNVLPLTPDRGRRSMHPQDTFFSTRFSGKRFLEPQALTNQLLQPVYSL
jgi:hypothetical protein